MTNRETMSKSWRHDSNAAHNRRLAKLSNADLTARDAQRDLNGELLEAIEELKAGQIGRVSVITNDGRMIHMPSPEKDAAITAAAESDPDARPLTDEEWAAVARKFTSQDSP